MCQKKSTISFATYRPPADCFGGLGVSSCCSSSSSSRGPGREEVLGHPATYSMDRDLWLKPTESQSRRGEMGVWGSWGRGALCHVQARTE